MDEAERRPHAQRSRQAGLVGRYSITGDITGVETYGTIFSIEESPVAKGTIWVGTDDGLVQVTRDGGASWSNVTPKGFPAWATVEGIEASARDADTAYVAIDARRVDDQKPYLYRTRDGGRSWTSITNGLPAEQMLFVVREDPVDPNILYVGGENGVFISRNAGDSFAPLKLNLPAIAVTDLEVKHGALVLGTRRSIWSLDDLATVRQARRVRARRTAARLRAGAGDPLGEHQHWGSQGKIDNPPDGVTVSYWLAKKSEEPVTGEVKDESGRVIRKLSRRAAAAEIRPRRRRRADRRGTEGRADEGRRPEPRDLGPAHGRREAHRREDRRGQSRFLGPRRRAGTRWRSRRSARSAACRSS